MELTGQGTAEPVRTIAEAMGLMMVKVEAREYRMEMLIKELEEMNQQVRRNTIATVTSMAKALAARDAYTQGHAERVGQIAGLIAATKDKRTFGLKEKFTRWGSAEDAFQFWAERLKSFMDKVHGRSA
jgi:HD-GYP domain-containing protein (c-di-GMP phosphodiesterase class II)